MKLSTFFLFLFLAVISVFAAINWGTFTTPATLSLVFGAVHAPLGLIMLGIVAFLTALFILSLVLIQASALLEVRRRERELQAMRELAEKAESSRFTALQEIFEKETQRIVDMGKESGAEMLTRLEKLESALGSAIEQSGNSLAAYIGELEDRLERGAGQTSGPST